MKIIANGPELYFPLFQGMEGEEVEIIARGIHLRESMIMGVDVDGLRFRGSIRVLWQDIEMVKFLKGLTRDARRAERA